jgi:hypothetical protein
MAISKLGLDLFERTSRLIIVVITFNGTHVIFIVRVIAGIVCCLLAGVLRDILYNTPRS